MKLATALFVCLMIGACASQPQPPEIPPTLKRAKPLEAMGPSRQEQVVAACKFRPQFRNLEAEDQLALLRNCVEVLGPTMRIEATERQTLVKWIEAE